MSQSSVLSSWMMTVSDAFHRVLCWEAAGSSHHALLLLPLAVSIQFIQEEYTVGESDGALFVTFEVVKGRVTRPISISLVPLPGTANSESHPHCWRQ